MRSLAKNENKLTTQGTMGPIAFKNMTGKLGGKPMTDDSFTVSDDRKSDEEDPMIEDLVI